MIVWGPGRVREDAAAVAAHPWAGQDLLPTFAEAAGVRPPSDVDGQSVLGLITGDAAPAARPLYWERSPYPGADVDGSPPAPVTFSQAVRDGRWKAVRWPLSGSDPDTPDADWRFELYDLQADRGETRDVALLHPQLRPVFEAVMRDHHAAPPYRRAPWPAG